MPSTPLTATLARPENRRRDGVERGWLDAATALRSEAFAEDLVEPAPQAQPGSGTIRSPWWWKVFDGQRFKSRGVAGVPVGAGAGLGGRPA